MVTIDLGDCEKAWIGVSHRSAGRVGIASHRSLVEAEIVDGEPYSVFRGRRSSRGEWMGADANLEPLSGVHQAGSDELPILIEVHDRMVRQSDVERIKKYVEED